MLYKKTIQIKLVSLFSSNFSYIEVDINIEEVVKEKTVLLLMQPYCKLGGDKK